MIKSTNAIRLGSIVTALTLYLSGVRPSPAASFLTTNSLATLRAYHTATLLGNGNVLVAGGHNGTGGGEGLDLSSAELYNPDSGTWSSTGSLNTARQWAAAVLLPSGKVQIGRASCRERG